MNNLMEYKGYHAKIEFDAEDMIFVGEVFGISDSLNFHGTSIEELTEMFHISIDDYLQMCAELGKEPDKEFKGSFNVRISPELHREAALAALQQGITLNQYVAKAVELALSDSEPPATGVTTVVVSEDLFHAVVKTNERKSKDSFVSAPEKDYCRTEMISIG